LPYCQKCGVQLKEDDEYCSVCGTRVGLARGPRLERRRHAWPAFPVFALVAILVTATVIVAFLFIPMNPVKLARSEGVAYQSGITTLKLNLTTDIGRINVNFENMPNKLVALNISATGGTTILAPPNPLNITFNHAVAGSTLTVTSSIHRATAWTMPYGLNVVCDLYINPSMKTNVKAETSVGSVRLDSEVAVVFESLTLRATTGQVEATLEKATILGPVTLSTTTGGVSLNLKNTTAPANIPVTVKTTTGGITLDIQQDTSLPANVTLNTEATTGGIDHTITIHNGVAAKITSETTVGGITFTETGFNGTKALLFSENYPAASNFDISLKTTTGGVHTSATYTP